MTGWKWRLACILVLLAGLAAASCTGTGYTPAQADQIGFGHSGSDGGDSGGSSM